MKLARFGEDRVGLVQGDVIVDVTDVAGVTPGEWPPVGMNRLIANFGALKPKLERAATSGEGVPLSSVRLLTPVPWPSKVVAYPVNYHDHGAEMHVGYRADNQGFFLKPPSSVSGPSDPIVLPVNAGRRIDHECELAIVIGKECRDVCF
jgi:2-keto-4-pentenoate hydratase/2-oxohepta-3-ene-1,7-dioic acid hydratase in catechol pathway